MQTDQKSPNAGSKPTKPDQTAKASPTIEESVIPDCCNVGVTFRALLAVNIAVMLTMMMRPDGFRAFLKVSALLEPSSLISLLALCMIRRVMYTLSPWAQRAICGVVPAVVAGFLITLMAHSYLDLDIVSAEQGMLLGAAFGFALQHYFELRARALSPALSEARLQALQARIRPHFLFNSLNAVLSLIRTEPLRAETTLEDLAELFRVLMRDARDVTSLEDEIRLCKKYLAIEKIRLGERLQVEWKASNISDRLLTRARIPALLLQPLLENAVHYGVEPAREPVTIQIELSRNVDEIDIIITNPISASANALTHAKDGNHMALENIRQRLHLMYDVEAKLEIKQTANSFEVRVRLPYVRS